MADRTEIPYLIRLLDDESPTVRDHVRRELLAFGAQLEQEIRVLGDSLSGNERLNVEELLSARRETTDLDDAWRGWAAADSYHEQLETAFESLARYQYGWAPPVRVSDLLDELADDYQALGAPTDPLSLSRYLFIMKRLTGNADDYYNPLNSNLIHVMQERKGISISLSCVFTLVGHRVGLDVHGCAVPGHFLSRAEFNGKTIYIDCFKGGRVLSADEVNGIRERLTTDQQGVLMERPTPVEIISRVINNLVHAYTLRNDQERVRLFRGLGNELVQAVNA